MTTDAAQKLLYKMEKKYAIMDGNEAASWIAYKTNEICAIYPITPSSNMGENVDEWSSQGKTNIWGNVPKVIEMQSEGGAAGTVHGALQGGALSTTFTASQGLLLMIPNMFKIAGELTPTVFHIAARSVATHALSIFGDHSDVMAVRSTGFAMLFADNVQEAMDFALISQAATLKSRIPFMHIFDGFRTSHELTKVEVIPDEIIRAMINEKDVIRHRNNSLNPNSPVIRGTAQNPDVFFQGREASNKYYDRVPDIVEEIMDNFAYLTGRKYNLFDYTGDTQAEHVIIMMGSGTGAVKDCILNPDCKLDKVGLLNVRLYRPFSAKKLIEALPPTVKTIAVLDRTKESGSNGEPLYQEIISALVENYGMDAFYKEDGIRVIGGRYGLSSKEFTPAMVHAIFEEMQKPAPKKHFTVGINDDVTNLSLNYNNIDYSNTLHEGVYQSLFYGLGADGTVGANKNTIKIIGDTTDMFVQGYFVYDSKKSGSQTVSHLRFSPKPIHSSYLIEFADFVACHQFGFLEKYDVLEKAKEGATFLLNAPYAAHEVWDKIPSVIKQEIISKKLNFYVVDADSVARETGMGKRVNSILQTCFFAISGLLPQEEAIQKIKDYIQKTYQRKGDAVVQKNFEAVDMALQNLHKIEYTLEPTHANGSVHISEDAPAFMKNVLGKILYGKGDQLPVSSLPADGTYPTGTSKWEKRFIAKEVPIWHAESCTQCAKCLIICPHAAIRAKVYDKELLENAPETFKHANPVGKEFDKTKEAYTIQVSVEDCTGCQLCVEICPVNKKENSTEMAIEMAEALPLRESENKNWDFFMKLPELDRSRLNRNSVKGSQFLQPLFEFSGACSGCGETPYLKLLSQLFGDRTIIANATGCSSIYGGNLPTTPWTTNSSGRGPSWANSLFEDNAEFGLGIRKAIDFKSEAALKLVANTKSEVGTLADEILNAKQETEEEINQQRERIKNLNAVLDKVNTPEARHLKNLAQFLARQSVWIVGGDGWAYDIGFGGLDHVMSTGENVKILVLDTEVYSNTGGQKSKSTPLGASARFAISGKKTSKKDLALMTMNYGNVYVAQIAVGANDLQTVRAFNEAEAYNGPSLIIAYSPCIAHGFEMNKGVEQQEMAVKSGYWPLFRFDPGKEKGKRFTLDSKEPSIPLKEYLFTETRFSNVLKFNPEFADSLFEEAVQNVKEKWMQLERMKAEM